MSERGELCVLVYHELLGQPPPYSCFSLGTAGWAIVEKRWWKRKTEGEREREVSVCVGRFFSLLVGAEAYVGRVSVCWSLANPQGCRGHSASQVEGWDVGWYPQTGTGMPSGQSFSVHTHKHTQILSPAPFPAFTVIQRVCLRSRLCCHPREIQNIGAAVGANLDTGDTLTPD